MALEVGLPREGEGVDVGLAMGLGRTILVGRLWPQRGLRLGVGRLGLAERGFDVALLCGLVHGCLLFISHQR